MSATNTINSTPTSTSTASCVTVTPGKDGYVPEWACNSNYNYDPSLPAAVIFTIIFGVTTSLHIYQAFRYKKLRLCWTLLMGATWEFASFCVRILGTRNQQSSALATVSQLLVLLAPMWVNAFVYMVLGRMIYFFHPEKQIWRVRGIKIAMIFVWLDVISFLTQVVGGVMISPGASQSTIMTGIHIYMGGIGFQQFCILLFTSIAVRMQLELIREENNLKGSGSQILDERPRNWRKLLYVLYATLALITTRIIFRLVEFASGLDPSKNPIPFHEAYFMALDALPMFIALVLLNIVHPGKVLQGEGSEFPRQTRKEKKEAKRIKKAEKKAAKENKKALRQQQKESSSFGSDNMV